MKAVQFTHEEFEAILKNAAGMGRTGANGKKDTELVHVNKDEERLLKEAGGSGKINPETGLKEFASSRPQDTHGRAAPGSAGRKTDSARGQKETGSLAKDRKEREFVSKGNSADPKERAQVTKAYQNRNAAIDDYNDVDNTFFDKVLTGIGNMVGISEIDPTKRSIIDQQSDSSAEADVGFDPIAALLSAGGLAFPPAKLASLAYTGAQYAGLFEGPQIALTNKTGMIDPSLSSAENAIQTAAGGGQSIGARLAGGGRQGGTGGKGEKSTGNLKSTGNNKTTDTRNSVATPTTPETVTPVKTPADILLDKWKLPGINAPLSIAPYTIDRTRHEQLVSSALQGRGGN